MLYDHCVTRLCNLCIWKVSSIKNPNKDDKVSEWMGPLIHQVSMIKGKGQVMFVCIVHQANIPVVCAIFVYKLCEINLILYVNSDLPVPYSE